MKWSNMISVLLCTYNRAQLLPRAIESVLNQTYKDIELIIVDDGSTDNTEEIIKAYDDSRIRYFKMARNSYYCYAANYGLSQCKGKYVAFMNSDDVWIPEKLEKQHQFLEKGTDYGACFSEVALIDDQGNDITAECMEMSAIFSRRFETQKEYIQSLLKNGNCLCHPSAVVRKEMLDKIGGFNLMFCQLADYDLWIRLVTEAPICVLKEKLIRFRWDKNAKDQISGVSAEKNRRVFSEQILIRKQLINRLSDEKFKEYFGDWFRNKNSKSHLELEFERAFVLLECMGEAPELKVLGVEKIEQVMRMPAAMETLRNHFEMDIFDLYRWNTEHMYYTPWVAQEIEELKQAELRQTKKLAQKEEYIKDLEQRIANTEEQVMNLENLIETYENSTSWKVTKPLRDFMRMVKNIKK